ncbi:MAG: glutathione synthase [Deltaproteobacteria bacterium]|nr:MAG: glutathione synthase [Deltaproteobacteria bacterium]
MRSLFVMDPLVSIDGRSDSTYAVMRECHQRGYPVAACEPRALFARQGEAFAAVNEVEVLDRSPWFQVNPASDRSLSTFDVVWMRKDPPFDMSYIFATYLLDMVAPPTLVLNDPKGLKLFNEKLWAMRFVDLHPPTLLSREPARIAAFVKEQPGRSVIKPWDGNGGRGVLVTSGGDRNLNSMIELLTEGGHASVLAQPFLERADEGDKRIMLFDGEPVGAMLRVPTAEDFRGNMHAGAKTVATELTPRDREICDRLGPELRANGQLWVGIDVIDGWLTEINITSPTGFHELRALYGKRLESELVDRVEVKVRNGKEFS